MDASAAKPIDDVPVERLAVRRAASAAEPVERTAAKPDAPVKPVAPVGSGERLGVNPGASEDLGDQPAVEPIESTASGNADTLSAREVEVLRLIALGYTSAEVARKLRLSPRTVETHRGRINRKLGASKRSDLVRYALRRGLLGV